ncbi:hypothetical protein EOD42_23370 [Rhodovarius crocodyli]|uniref:Uncharacterized protein n=1 Tax=Rhodovarius crocodyli TaxID=1979269 RepID=A0A437LZF3_9PROT|nr:hypothetical protein [Rhodovarius crocodyli]RVT90745.1 hypothetical protein EOD42_23370 [Rhodovarius crocodyli]
MAESNLYCRVENNPSGGTTVHACDALQSVLTSGPWQSAGAHISTFRSVKGAAYSHRLVINPLKKQGRGLIANFCPFCAEPLNGEASASFAQVARQQAAKVVL